MGEVNVAEVASRAFKGMGEDYENIIGFCYPTYGSNGYDESNQTHCFVTNFLRLVNEGRDTGDCRKSAFAWFEAPLKGGGRIDAVILDYENSYMLLIEAKRIYGNAAQKKEGELINQIIRVTSESVRKDLAERFDLNYNKEKIRTYMVILADYWGKDGIRDWWMGKDADHNIFNELNKHVTWNNNQTLKPIEARRETEGVDYHLLFGFHDFGEVVFGS